MDRTARFLLILSLWMMPDILRAAPRPGFIEDDFVLFWPVPTRAYPGIPLDFRLAAYEADNAPLTWTLQNAPVGMTVNSSGLVEWTPTAGQIGSQTLTVSVGRPDGADRARTLTLTVGTDDFLFVSPTGSDANPGTLSSPYRTIEHALRQVASGNGKTVYLRGGVYREHYDWESGGAMSPTRGKSFSAGDPLIVRSHPGEWAVLDCESQGHGLWAYDTQHVIFGNLEVANANVLDRGGLMAAGNHIYFHDTVVHDSHWICNGNATGYLVQRSTDVVLLRTVGYDNTCSAGPGAPHNQSNYLFYTEDVPAGTIHVLNSKSYGSHVGFKIKHGGPKRLIVHGCESFNDQISFGLASGGSSVRYSVSYNAGVGFVAGISDANAPYYRGGMLFEHNTIVNAPATGLSFQDASYAVENSRFLNNIVFNSLSAAGTGEDDDRLMTFWRYTPTATAGATPLTSDRNLFFSPSQSNIVRLGNSAGKDFSFTSWRGRGQDAASVFGDPGFADRAAGDLAIAPGSPADFGGGEFAGAFTPGRAYPLVGQPGLPEEIIQPGTTPFTFRPRRLRLR
jgi:hypothetical protein